MGRGQPRRSNGRGMRIAAVLIDIDGVLTVSWRPLPGAVAALRRLRAAGLPLALVTNTTSRPRASIAAALARAGFPVSAAAHPERFVRQAPQPPKLPAAAWINRPEKEKPTQ